LASPAGPYSITCSGAVDPNYTIAYVPGTLTIAKVPLTITADNQSSTYGVAIPTLTASYSGLVNGDNSASLTNQPTCSTASTSASPVGPYSISCSGAVDPNYTIAYAPGTLTIGAAPQMIAFTSTAPTGATTGGQTYSVAAAGGGSGQPVLFSSTTTSVRTLSGSTVRFVGPGSCVIDANQAGDANHSAALVVNQTFTVSDATPVITSTSPLPTGTVGVPYSTTLVASGGTGGPYTWTLTSGSLPPGLTLNPNGTISGTPTASGMASFAIAVGDPATGTFTVMINPAAALTSPTQTNPPSPLAAQSIPFTPLTTGSNPAALAFTGLSILKLVGLAGTLIIGGALIASASGRRRRRTSE
jgi:hypothetical protein